jgi:hypothetical protein
MQVFDWSRSRGGGALIKSRLCWKIEKFLVFNILKFGVQALKVVRINKHFVIIMTVENTISSANAICKFKSKHSPLSSHQKMKVSNVLLIKGSTGNQLFVVFSALYLFICVLVFPKCVSGVKPS